VLRNSSTWKNQKLKKTKKYKRLGQKTLITGASQKKKKDIGRKLMVVSDVTTERKGTWWV
jgi:hypothetical protein